MLAAQRRSELAWNEAVHELHALDVPRVGHHLEERAIEWQRTLELRKFGGARLTEQLRLFPIGTLGVSGVHPVYVSTIVRPAAPSASASKNAPVSAR